MSSPRRIDFAFDDASSGVLRIDSGKFAQAISRESDSLANFLLGEELEDGRNGLLAALDKALDEIGASLLDRLDPVMSLGLVIDLKG